MIGAKFCANEETTLIMKEKLFSWSGDDFKIKVPEFVMHYICVLPFWSARSARETRAEAYAFAHHTRSSDARASDDACTRAEPFGGKPIRSYMRTPIRSEHARPGVV